MKSKLLQISIIITPWIQVQRCGGIFLFLLEKEILEILEILFLSIVIFRDHLLKLCHWSDNWRHGVIIPDMTEGYRLKEALKNHLEMEMEMEV